MKENAGTAKKKKQNQVNNVMEREANHTFWRPSSGPCLTSELQHPIQPEHHQPQKRHPDQTVKK